MNYDKYLTLYSGGADSTYFIEKEKTARHLIHYEGLNPHQTRIATINSNLLGRYLTVIEQGKLGNHSRDGETNAIHALYDTQMALDASIIAVSHGMKGIVMCFNADDIGIETEAVTQIMKAVEPEFELLLPLRDITGSQIRKSLAERSLRYISCMYAESCGFCAKCTKRYLELAINS